MAIRAANPSTHGLRPASAKRGIPGISIAWSAWRLPLGQGDAEQRAEDTEKKRLQKHEAN